MGGPAEVLDGRSTTDVLLYDCRVDELGTLPVSGFIGIPMDGVSECMWWSSWMVGLCTF